MKIIEILDWILDKNDKRINGEEEYLLNIEFVHSLGLARLLTQSIFLPA